MSALGSALLLLMYPTIIIISSLVGEYEIYLVMIFS